MYDQWNKNTAIHLLITSDFYPCNRVHIFCRLHKVCMYVMSLVAHASERGSADAQSGEEGDGLLQLRTRSRKRASRYGSGKDEWTGTSSAKHARPAASAKSDELEKRISTAIGFTHQFKFAGASPQITNQQQVIIKPWNRLQCMCECTWTVNSYKYSTVLFP